MVMSRCHITLLLQQLRFNIIPVPETVLTATPARVTSQYYWELWRLKPDDLTIKLIENRLNTHHWKILQTR